MVLILTTSIFFIFFFFFHTAAVNYTTGRRISTCTIFFRLENDFYLGPPTLLRAHDIFSSSVIRAVRTQVYYYALNGFFFFYFFPSLLSAVQDELVN